MSAKHQHSSQSQIVDAGLAIRQHCHQDDEGFAIYEHGWSDQKIADQTGATLSTVTSLRRTEFGALRHRGGGGASLEELRGRVAALEERVDALIELLNADKQPGDDEPDFSKVEPGKNTLSMQESFDRQAQ